MAALTTPPLWGIKTALFQITRKQQITASGAGAVQVIDRARPFWRAEFSSPPLMGDAYNNVMAFLDQLEGAANSFLCYDPRRIMPYAYANTPVTNDPWTQTGQTAPRITSADYTNSQITLDRLQTGAIITKGDYISFFDGLAYYLYRSTQTIVVTSSHSVVLSVQPRPLSIATAYNITYRKAPAEMKIVGGITESGAVDSPTTVSFKAFQFTNKV